MILSFKEIIKYKKINQKIAFETEGSLDKKHLLLMQKPNEFDNFSKSFFFRYWNKFKLRSLEFSIKSF